MRTATLFFALSFFGALAAGCTQQPATTAGSGSNGPLASDARTMPVVALQIGEPPPAFDVEDVTGPSQGEYLCYRCKYAGRPTVAIFTRKIDDSVTSLVQQIDQKVVENAEHQLSAFMVVIGENTEQVKPELQRIQVAQNIQNTPLTVLDNPEGPPGYGLSPEAEIQVMMWNNQGLQVNRPITGPLTKEEIAELANQTEQILN